jgi:hypothetical protein
MCIISQLQAGKCSDTAGAADCYQCCPVANLACDDYLKRAIGFYGRAGVLPVVLSVRAGTFNRYLSPTLKERLRACGAPKLEIRSGHFLEVVIVDQASAGRHQENFGRTSTKNAPSCPSANARWNFGAPRALRRSLSVIHSSTDLTSRPGLTVLRNSRPRL